MYARHPEIARRWSEEEKAVSSRYGSGTVAGRRITEPVAKADWMGIEEHKRRARDSRRTKTAGNVLGSLGLAGGAVVAMNHPRSWSELREIGQAGRGRVVPTRFGEEPHEFRVKDGKMGASAAQRARNVVRAAKVRPGGAVLGGTLGLAGLGAGTWAVGRANENRHDRAVSRIRRQRASASVGKALSMRGAKNFVLDTADEVKDTFRPFGAGEGAAAHGVAGRGGLTAGKLIRLRAAETLINRPRAVGAIGGGAALGTYGLGRIDGRIKANARHRKEEASKRYRDYNHEHRRQRRIGMAEAALIGGGGTAAGFGGHGIYRDTKALRGLEIAKPGRSGIERVGQSAAGRGAVALSRKNGLLLLGGGAGLAGAAGLRRWAEGNRGRAYS